MDSDWHAGRQTTVEIERTVLTSPPSAASAASAAAGPEHVADRCREKCSLGPSSARSAAGISLAGFAAQGIGAPNTSRKGTRFRTHGKGQTRVVATVRRLGDETIHVCMVPRENCAVTDESAGCKEGSPARPIPNSLITNTPESGNSSECAPKGTDDDRKRKCNCATEMCDPIIGHTVPVYRGISRLSSGQKRARAGFQRLLAGIDGASRHLTGPERPVWTACSYAEGFCERSP